MNIDDDKASTAEGILNKRESGNRELCLFAAAAGAAETGHTDRLRLRVLNFSLDLYQDANLPAKLGTNEAIYNELGAFQIQHVMR